MSFRGGLEPPATSPDEARRFARGLWSWAAAGGLGLLAFTGEGTSDGVVFAYNDAFARMWSVPAGAPASIGSFLSHVAAQLTGADGDELLARARGGADSFHRRVTRKDGRVFEWWSTPVEAHERGAPLRIWGVRDVGTDVDPTAALRATESGLQILAAYTDGVVFELDAEARYLSAWTNDAALLVRPWRELEGRTVAEVLGDPIGTQLTENVERLLSTGDCKTLEYVLDVPAGRRWFTAEPVLPPALPGRPPTVVLLVRDITEQKKLQARLLQAERIASMGTLAAGVGHEINNPLGYLMLNLESIAALLPGEDRDAVVLSPSDLGALRDALRMAREGAEHVRKIVQDLRTFTRDERPQACAVDVRAVLDFAIAMALRAPPPGLRVLTDYGEVPPVRAPEGRLVQLFVNLLTNAVHAMPEGRIEGNEIELVVRSNDSGDVVVDVRDNGVGIAAEAASRVFDPFFTTKAPGIGSGLGLSICHHIVTTLGGEISVESQEGVGTVFRVVLSTSTAPSIY